jgi:hypothetical protein
VPYVIGLPRGVLRRRRERQLVELEQVRAANRGREFEIDWIKYKEIPKSELLDVLGKHGWHYVGEQVGGKSWLLRFSLEPATTSEEPTATRRPDSRKRLAEELKAAQPGVDGTYLLDSSQYLDLPMDEIGRAVHSAGWKVVRLSPESPRSAVVLTRPGTTTVDFLDGPFAGTSTPAELRQNPRVLARAAEIEREKGFDPLSETELNRARERHKHWVKPFNRQVLLAFLYGFVGLFMLAGTLASAEGNTYRVLLAVSLIVLALFAIAALKARLIRKKRRAEIGDILDAYEELRRLHETP